jgi:nucleoside-specific outer membrane channel protein Tsx
MRFSHLVATLLVLTSVAIAQSVAHAPASKGKPETSWSSLPPDARRTILAALEKDDAGWSQQAELSGSDGSPGSGFGISVAVDGGTAVVGARTNGPNSSQGAAYVFIESGGTWSQQAKLTASDGEALDQFGQSVAVSGSTIVVGAPHHPFLPPGNGPAGNGLGVAYVFVENGGEWSQQAELEASDGAAGENFGCSVAVSGSTAVVGAADHTVGPNQDQGAVYVFAPSGGTWTQQAELTASDGGANDEFGNSVAVSSSMAVVGAPGHWVGSNELGAAYVFVQSGTTWGQQAELTASDGVANEGFGSSVAVDGNTAVVGAVGHMVGLNVDQGAAYVFVQVGTTWSQQGELIASDGSAGDYLGSSVAVSGSTAVAGTWLHTVGSNAEQGAAYVFMSSGGTWSQQAELTASDGSMYNGFGMSVAVSGGTVLAGAPSHEVGSNPGQGAAYVFGTGITVTLSPTSLGFGNQAIETTSAAKTVTLKNSGTGTLTISDIAASANFAVSSTSCGSVLLAGKACTVRVTFTPTVLGTVKGTLGFTDDAQSGPETVALSGVGVEPATLTPASVNYPPQASGTTSAEKTFTFTNYQTVELTILGISTTGDFSVSATTCGASLSAKTHCTISVTFTPSETGMRMGHLVVNDSASNNPQTSNLQGKGK